MRLAFFCYRETHDSARLRLQPTFLCTVFLNTRCGRSIESRGEVKKHLAFNFIENTHARAHTHIAKWYETVVSSAKLKDLPLSMFRVLTIRVLRKLAIVRFIHATIDPRASSSVSCLPSTISETIEYRREIKSSPPAFAETKKRRKEDEGGAFLDNSIKFARFTRSAFLRMPKRTHSIRLARRELSRVFTHSGVCK